MMMKDESGLYRVQCGKVQYGTVADSRVQYSTVVRAVNYLCPTVVDKRSAVALD